MKAVCITGSVGVGKTYVTKLFFYLGIPVFDADSEAKRILVENKLIQNMLPDNMYHEDKSLNKKALFQLLLSPSKKASAINHKIHSATIQAFNVWKESLDETMYPFCIKESAIIYETHKEQTVDIIIAVDAPISVRKRRYMTRTGTSIESWRTINNRQISNKQKIRKADYVIYNDGDQLVFPQVHIIYKSILASCSKSAHV